MSVLEKLEFVGESLHRPECVLATSSGNLHVADWRRGVTIIAPDGSQRSTLANAAFTPKPNDIGILADGS